MTPPVDIDTPEDDAADLAGYRALVAELRAQNAALAARVAELERQLGLNSGKPPSSDGLKKKPARVSSLRERSGKKTGGQKGHAGKTLSRTETPDATIDHFPEVCEGCGAPLSKTAATDHTARQVVDLPEPRPLIVTEHRAFACRCGNCGKQTRAAFPEGVNAPVQYGVRIAAFVVYLLHYQLLPERRLAELMADLFGVNLVTATIASMSQSCAARFQGFVAAVRDHVAAAPVKHLDETGFRIGGKTQWLHIASTTLLTFYRISPKRGSLPEGVTGIAVHDHWKPYYTLKGVLHALCNAHHLRELKALVVIERCYDAILAQGFAFHASQPALVRASGKAKRRGRTPRRVGHNLLLRLSTRKPDVLRFLSDPAVPFTNNQAERDGRMMKLRQKISGGFRSEDGAAEFGVIRSLLSTAKKQGWDMLGTLTANPLSLILDLRVG